MPDETQAPQTPPALRVDDVTKSYGRFDAVTDLSFTVAPGTTVGVFGPNGAGKTTLLRMLAGLARPTSGTVSVGGDTRTPGDPTAARDVGVVTHDSMLYDELTARENLRFHARLRGIDDVEGRCAAVLDAVRLSRRASQRPAAFSHGLRKRLSLARALLSDPDVLLLDEPYAGLDQRSVADLAAVLDDFDDRTVVLTTHDLDRGFRRCDRALVVARGRLAADFDLDSMSATEFEAAYRRGIGLDGDDRPRGDRRGA